VALQLRVVNGETVVKELWTTNRMRVHIGNLLRIGDALYGSSDDFGPAPLTALDAKTGKVLWRDRSFPKATFLYADGKLILVDEDAGNSVVWRQLVNREFVSSTVPDASRNFFAEEQYKEG
jgi:hypothetical protein